MIGHWLVTAWRSLISNPLFSAITIISLSIGCAGALLAGSNVLQHLSFERHVPEGERVWVVTLKRPDPNANLPPGVQVSFRSEGPAINRPQAQVIGPMRAAIDGKIPGMEAQARMVRGNVLLKEDQDEQDRRQAAGLPAPGELQKPFPGTIYVDPDFFKVFPQVFLEGSAEKIGEPDHILLTERRAKRLFGAQSAVGQTVEGVKGRSLTVIGVVKDPPVASHQFYESIAGIKTQEIMDAAQRASDAAAVAAARPPGPTGPGAPQIMIIRSSMDTWQAPYGGAHYLKMEKGADPKAFKEAAIRALQAAGDQGSQQTASAGSGGAPDMVMRAPKFTYSVVPLFDAHLAGPEVVQLGGYGDATMLLALSAAAFALLAVSAFNYVTLSLARALRRRREVAIRKVLGGSQASLIQQYFVESSIVTLISLLIGFVLAQFLFPWFARAIGQPETLFNLFDPAFLAWTGVGLVLLVLAVGAYPAFYLANVRPRTALGEGGTAAPGRIGQFVTAALMGLQIAAATGLLIVSMTMGAQANYIETRPMGYDMKDRYQFVGNCPLSMEMTPAQLSALLQRCNTISRDLMKNTPGVEQVFYFQGQLISESVQTQGFGRGVGGEETGRGMRMSVDTEFLQGMGATLLAGRFFNGASAYDRQLADRQANVQGPGPRPPGSPPPPKIEKLPAIITRAALPMVGADTPEQAIGKQIFARPTTSTSYPFEVVGVIEDWQMRPLKYSVLPIVFTPAYPQAAILKIAPGKADSVKADLVAGFREKTGDSKANISLTSLAQVQERAYQGDYRLMRAVSSFALVAIVVAGLGVFGLSTFEMRRRVREIGIRKALGASPSRVAGMVIGRQVGFAAAVSLIAWPIGFWIGNQWLQGFVYRTDLGWFVPPLATLIAIAIVAIAVGLSSARAAAMRPGAALNG